MWRRYGVLRRVDWVRRVTARRTGRRDTICTKHHADVLIKSFEVTLTRIAHAWRNNQALCGVLGMPTGCKRGVLDDEVVEDVARLVVETGSVVVINTTTGSI